MAKTSVKGVARTAKAADRAARKKAPQVQDSFQNFQAKLGIGTDNLTSASTYGFNPITRNRILCEWMHRGTWLGGIAIDIVGDDMTKRGVEFTGELDPDDQDHLDRAAETWDIWSQINDTVRWSRLYGGAIAVMLIDGQNMSTPLRIQTVGKGQFKGLFVLDRWNVEPSLQDLVTEYGPNMGMPKYYTVIGDAAALRGVKIHYSRILRMEGVRLPYWQRVMENLWGTSIFERLYDRMVAFDSATTGVAQLVYKAYLRTYNIKGMRELIAAGGKAEQNLVRYVQTMTRFQSVEGITLIDGDDVFSEHVGGAAGMRGIADVMLKLGEQLSGALQIPLVRLFGQAPTGLNSTGESEMKMYYDGINMQQNRVLRNPVTTIYRVMAQSEGVKLPEGFGIEFRPLKIMDDLEKAQIAAAVTQAVAQADQSGIPPRHVSLEELKQSSRVTGIWTNITDEDIEQAKQDPPPGAAEALGLAQQEQGREQERADSEAPGDVSRNGGRKGPGNRDGHRSKTRDTDLGARKVLGFDVVIEHGPGEVRFGNVLPTAYGYIRQTRSAEGADQMDCFVGKDLDGKIFIIDSYDENGVFDEAKIMLGYPHKDAALKDFREYYK